ncbi:MAG: CHAT domain-containing protein, partial [bacterium]|nr:CHAT domain-containing protein [bacterium]
LLIDEGRLSEAQSVLDMLKDEEYFQFIRRDRSYSPTLNLLDFNTFEKEWLDKHNNATKKLAQYTAEYYLLKNKKTKTDPDKKRLKELNIILGESRTAYHKYLTQLKEAFAENIKKGTYQALTLLEHAKALQSTLSHLDEKEEGKNVVINYLVHEGKITAIITTPHTQMVVKTPRITAAKLNRMIMKYRKALLNREDVPRGTVPVNTTASTDSAGYKELYDQVFQPVDEVLKKYGATNLMVYLDGVLRYISLPALWDGETFLVQRYRISVFTTSSLARIQLAPVNKKRILGLGAGAGGSGFTALPNVKEEIRSIVRDKKKGFHGLIHGRGLLDKDFTRESFLSQLETNSFSLVHISSHFTFSPGDETKNILLLGDGSVMTLGDIRRCGNLFYKVELLMLAACETAMGGNGMEIDGFGELAQQSGANSVVASLWKVRDKSTKDLMVNFYSIIKNGNASSKIEALRLAQLKLAGLEDLLAKNKRARVKESLYSHPYYWG